MKPKPILSGLLLVLICLSFNRPSSASVPRQASDAPYLMAFSPTPTPHFVIERADGTDSRIFAADVMPDDTNTVDGPGWSPSGAWLAWTASTRFSMFDTGDRPFILSADGQTRLTGLDDMNRVTLAWSPKADVLLVAGLVNPPETGSEYEDNPPIESLTQRVGLFDPNTDRFINFQDTTLTYEGMWPRYRVVWTVDGRYGLALHREPDTYGDSLPEDGENMTFYVLGPDQPISATSLPANRLMYVPYNYLYYDVMGTVIAPTGEVPVFDDAGHLTLMNLANNTATPLNVPTGETILRMVWSPDGTQALVTAGSDYQENVYYQSTLYRYADGALTEILPARPAPIQVEAAPDFSIALIEELPETEWIISVLDLANLNLTPLDISLAAGGGAVTEWTGNHRVVITADNPSLEVSLLTAFDLTDPSAPVTLGQFNMTISSYDPTAPAIAPNSPVALYTSDQIYRVDVTSNQMTIFPPDPRRYFTSNRGEVHWHPTEDWAILLEDALVAGGGYPVYSEIINADGSVHRPVGYCNYIYPLCISWLPTQVDVTQLAAGTDNRLPQPIQTIPMGRWVGELQWSPDGTQIAAGGDMRWYAEPVLYEVWATDTGALTATFPDVAYDQTLDWSAPTLQITTRDVTPPDTYPRVLAQNDTLTVQLAQTNESGYGDTLQILDATGQVIASQSDLYFDWHGSASINPDNQLIALSSASTPVRLLDAQTGAVLYEMPLVYSNAVALSPDGQFLAITYATEIRIYRLSDLLGGQ